MKTFRNKLLTLGFAFTAAFAARGAADEMVLHCYPVPRFECDGTHGKHEDREMSAAELKAHFEARGVGFPPGSFINDEPSVSAICMFNTSSNHVALKRMMDVLKLKPDSVELDAAFIAFDLADIEAAARKNVSATPTREQVAELWKAGKGRLLGSQKFVTRSGVNANSAGANEQIYASEFVDSAGTNGAPTRPTLSPASFETREVGMIVNVTPTISPDGRSMDLVISPEFSEGEAWDDVATTLSRGENDEENLIVRVPRFHTAKLTTTLTLDDGTTMIQGGMSSRDGQSLIYFFLTPRIIGTDGKPVHPVAAPNVQAEKPKAK